MALGPVDAPSHEQVVAVQRFLQRGRQRGLERSLDAIFLALADTRWTVLGAVDERFAEVELEALIEEGLPALLLDPTQTLDAMQRAAGLERRPPGLVLDLLLRPTFVGATHLRLSNTPERVLATYTDRYDPTWQLFPSDWLDLPEGAPWQAPRVIELASPLPSARVVDLAETIDAARAVCARGLEPCRCRDGMLVSFRAADDAGQYDLHSCHMVDHGALRGLVGRALELALDAFGDAPLRARLSSTLDYVPRPGR